MGKRTDPAVVVVPELCPVPLFAGVVAGALPEPEDGDDPEEHPAMSSPAAATRAAGPAAARLMR
jgi:hypothetical protein